VDHVVGLPILKAHTVVVRRRETIHAKIGRGGMDDIILQIETKEKEIERLKEELKNIKGTECEIYDRIVGYYRPLKGWNPGKKDEFNLRKRFIYRNNK
jgi:hypothetical protein